MSKPEYTGHGANTGGLQQHSVGDSYPFTVVGTMHRKQTDTGSTFSTRYYVLDCATGDCWYWQPGALGPITWPDSESAHMVAQQLKDGTAGMCVVRV